MHRTTFFRATTIAIALAGLSGPAAGDGITDAPPPSPDNSMLVSDVAESSPVLDAVARYATYHSAVTSATSNDFASAIHIDETLSDLGGHNPDHLSQGWIAYAALIAAQNNDFRAAILDIESFYGRDAVTRGFQNDIRYAGTLSGAETAVAASVNAVRADRERLVNAAGIVKDQAYSLQTKGWARNRIRNATGRADGLMTMTQTGQAATLEARNLVAAPDMNARLLQAGRRGAFSLWDAISRPSDVAPDLTPDIAPEIDRQIPLTVNLDSADPAGRNLYFDRIATVAAFQLINDGTPETAAISRAMRDRKATSCMTMANLNLQQCVAASHRQYEVPFCIAEHAILDIGECIGGPENPAIVLSNGLSE